MKGPFSRIGQLDETIIVSGPPMVENRSFVGQHRTMTTRTILFLEKLRTMTTRAAVVFMKSWPWDVRRPRRVAGERFLLKITIRCEWYPKKHFGIFTFCS